MIFMASGRQPQGTPGLPLARLAVGMGPYVAVTDTWSPTSCPRKLFRGAAPTAAEALRTEGTEGACLASAARHTRAQPRRSSMRLRWRACGGVRRIFLTRGGV